MYTKLSLPLLLFILFYLFAALATQEELLVIIGVLSVLIVIGIVLVYLDVANKRKINEEKVSKVSTPQADDSGPDCMQVISNKFRIAAGLAQSFSKGMEISLKKKPVRFFSLMHNKHKKISYLNIVL